MQTVPARSSQYTTLPPSSQVHRNLPLFLSGIAFIFIVLGVSSIFFLQAPLQTQNQDIRKAASVETGLVTLATNFQDVSTTDPSAHLALSVNTHGVQTDGIQVIFNVITDTTDNLDLSVPSSSGLRATHQEVEKTADGFLVSLTAVPQSGVSFSSTQNQVFATINFKPTKAGQVRLAFDEGNSVSHVSGSTPLRDELKTIPAFNFSTVGPLNITNPPTNNDDLFFDAPHMSIRFYKTDGSNQNVSENDLQVNGYYKVQITFQVQNTYKSQVQDNRSIAVQYFRNGASISSKVYTYAFVSNSHDGFSDIFTDYFYFQPNTQFILGLDTTNSIQETNENNNSWTFTINPSTASSCNVSCSANQDCAPNFRCYYNQCRLATNVSSDSCSTPPDLGLHRQCNEYCADTNECDSGFTCFFNRCRRPENPDSTSCAGSSTTVAAAIAKSCNVTCSSNKDCGVNLRCDAGSCRLATNVSSLSCSPLTYHTVSVVYQNSSTGTKGEEIPLPNESPTTGFEASNSAESTASANSTISATVFFPSPSPVVIVPSPTPAAQNNIVQGISAVIGSSLASIAIAAGGALLVLALLAAVLNRARRNQKPPMSGQKMVSSQPSTPSEAKLADRIQELKQQQRPTSVPVSSTVPDMITPPPSAILPKSAIPVRPTPPAQVSTSPTQISTRPTQVPRTAVPLTPPPAVPFKPAVTPIKPVVTPFKPPATPVKTVVAPFKPPVAPPPIESAPLKSTPSSSGVSLASLRTPTTPPAAKPTAPASKPVAPTPSMAPPPVAATMAATPSPLTPSPSGSLSSPSSTMMQKIKTKGLDQNIPQPVEPSNLPTSSPSNTASDTVKN